MKVALLGLGIMGKAMAHNLHKEGYLFSVYNRTEQKTKEFQDLGITVGSTPKEAAQDADIIITMVSDSADVEEVILGAEGVIHSVKSGAIVVDMSSINPEVTKKIGAALKEKGVDMLDAPVSGGDKGAIAGTLAIMAGGDEKALEKASPVLKTMGSSVVHVGPLGMGGYAKLANNMIVAINLQAIAEAFTLAKRAGMDIESLYHAIRSGLAGSNVLDLKMEKLLSDVYEPGFKIALHLKDLNNAVQAGNSQDTSLPFTQDVTEIMKVMNDQGMGDMDHSALYKHHIDQQK